MSTPEIVTPDHKVRTQTRVGAWIAMIVGAVYFLFR